MKRTEHEQLVERVAERIYNDTGAESTGYRGVGWARLKGHTQDRYRALAEAIIADARASFGTVVEGDLLP
jgi:hypothetical protein